MPWSRRRVTTTFAITGLALLAAAAALLIISFRVQEIGTLEQTTERDNVSLARILRNAVWPRFSDFIATAGGLPANELAAHPSVPEIDRLIHTLIQGSAIVRVKIYDRDGTVTYATEHALIGDKESDNPRFAVARTGRIASEHVTARDRDDFAGAPYAHLVASYVPMRAADGKVEGVIEVYQDVSAQMAHIGRTVGLQIVVTAAVLGVIYLALVLIVGRADKAVAEKQRALEHALAEAEAANRAKTEFLANMSHELRTPLNAIIGFSEIIERATLGPVANPRYVEYAGDIHSSARHLLAIINDILDLSKVEAGKMPLEDHEVAPAELIEASLGLIRGHAEEKGIALAAEVPTSRPRLRADERRLRQVLLNLLSNAVKFTPEGGRIAVTVSERPEGLAITVADTGIGMAPADIPKALSPFGQVDGSLARRYEGTGLGLPLTKALIELHAGSLAIASTPGRGTTVTVVLPPERVLATATAAAA